MGRRTDACHDPDLNRRLPAGGAAPRGVDFARGAEVRLKAGTRTFMVGGDAEALAVARPLLEAMGSRGVHCGGSGSGQPLPGIPYSAVLTVERRVSHEGMVSLEGNHYSVPETTRKRVIEVQNQAVRALAAKSRLSIHFLHQSGR